MKIMDADEVGLQAAARAAAELAMHWGEYASDWDVYAGCTRRTRAPVIAFPTDTVFGLGCDAASEGAARRIFQIKGRPADQPLILMSDRADLLTALGEPSCQLDALAARFWPGPLTMVVPIRPAVRHRIAASVRAAGNTVGLRVPDHPVALAILAACGAPLATTSANLSGQPPAANVEELVAQLGDKVSLIISGGPPPSGVPSTVLDLSRQPPAILRPGAVSAEEIKAALGCEIASGGA